MFFWNEMLKITFLAFESFNVNALMNNATNIILFTKNLITIKLSSCKTYKQGVILFLKKKKKKQEGIILWYPLKIRTHSSQTLFNNLTIKYVHIYYINGSSSNE